jgi:hypothetical protein
MYSLETPSTLHSRYLDFWHSHAAKRFRLACSLFLDLLFIRVRYIRLACSVFLDLYFLYAYKCVALEMQKSAQHYTKAAIHDIKILRQIADGG